MKPEYKEWIRLNVEGDGYGKCRETCAEMQVFFPELKLVRGHYDDWMWGKREHWWMVAPDGSIVDPTAAQFPTGGRCLYIPWKDGEPEPIGRCPNCGEDVFNREFQGLCSKGCAKDYADYITREAKGY